MSSQADNDKYNSTGEAAAVAVLEEQACHAEERHLEKQKLAVECTTIKRVRAIVQGFRNVAAYFHRSPKAKSHFAKLQKENQLARLEVVMDCPTRWNSCRDMLERFVRIQPSIARFFEYTESPTGRREFPDIAVQHPEPEDWFAIKCLVALLDLIWGITELLSGEGYTTLGMVLSCLRSIGATLNRTDLFDEEVQLARRQPYVDDTLELMHKMRLVFHRLFRSRFSHSTIAVELKWVTLLDPRLDEMSSSELSDKQTTKEELVLVALDVAEANGSTALATPLLQSPPPGTSEKVRRVSRSNFFGSRARHSQSRSHVPGEDMLARVKSEEKYYLRESETALESDDTFVWWKARERKFPVLTQLARKWLACVSTSVPSKRAFSTSGNIVTARRCCLSPELVRDLVFIADNCTSP